MEEVLNQELQRVQASRSFSDEVRQLVAARLAQAPSAASVAKSLGVSERTLRRRLGVEGGSFRELIKDVRLQTAARLLAESDLSVGEIAARVGYQEMANLRRAFKATMGVSPREFRQRRQLGR